MLKRAALPHIKSLLKTNPAVVLLGPRQCGKTTLAKTLSPHYFDLEKKETVAALDVRWPDLLKISDAPLIFDEAQEYPLLFPRLRSVIDEKRRKKGRFQFVPPAIQKRFS